MNQEPARTTRPANILWRIMQGGVDDLIITAGALGLAWGLGVITVPANFIRLPRDLTFVEDVSNHLTLAARAGAVFAIYVAMKLAYYTAFVACGGKTPACYLLRLRVVRVDGRPVSLAGSAKRAVAGGALSHAPVVGHFIRFVDYAVALFNRRKQAVRDIIAGTMLVHDDGGRFVSSSFE